MFQEKYTIFWYRCQGFFRANYWENIDMTAANQVLRATFDQDALLYDQARPGYPEALIEDIVALSSLPPRGRILEIGCGTGQATLPFARRGYRLLAVELGANLATVARHKLAAYPDVEIQTGTFEAWPMQERSFDLAISGTAFHWIDPTVGYRKLAQALRSGGAAALFWNKHIYHPDDGGFFEAVQEVYRREAPDIFTDRPLQQAEEVEEEAGVQMGASGLFGPVIVRRYPWVQEYDAESYIRVHNTYSDHISLRPERRQRLYAGFRELIDTRFNGRVQKAYLSLLYLAHR